MSNQLQIQQGHRGGGIMRVGAIGLMILGAPIAILSILGALAEEPRLSIGGLLFLGVLGIILFVSGIIWLRSISAGESMTQSRREEELILNLAARHGGALTIAQVVTESGLTANQAEVILERLTSQRLLQPDLLDDGSIVYRVRGLEA
jgi:hypothetical protein